jgi:hypothetical protein
MDVLRVKSVAARRIVTAVEATRYRPAPANEEERQPMGVNLAASHFGKLTRPKHELAIAEASSALEPGPALIISSSGDLRPEPVLQRTVAPPGAAGNAGHSYPLSKFCSH